MTHIRPNITVLDGYTLNPNDLSWDALETLGNLSVYARTPAPEIVARAHNASIILTNKTPLTAQTLAQLPTLRYIGVLATGYNVVDVVAATQQGITVTNIPAYGTHSVAQMVIAHLLTLCHRVQRHSDAVTGGAWSQSPDWCFWQSPQIELAGKVMGIIGLGNIGHQIGRIASALGMSVQAYSPRPREVTDIAGFRWVALDELFSTSDVVSLNCPLTPETTHLINRETLALMKKNAFLLNASRGGLIAEQDLADALNMGRIAGAGLDVLSTEPPTPDNPLLAAKNVLITPHMAWATREARQRLLTQAVENVRAFLNGQPLNVVNIRA